MEFLKLDFLPQSPCALPLRWAVLGRLTITLGRKADEGIGRENANLDNSCQATLAGERVEVPSKLFTCKLHTALARLLWLNRHTLGFAVRERHSSYDPGCCKKICTYYI